jgi:hypothetical protein
MKEDEKGGAYTCTCIGNILVKFRLESLNQRHHLEDSRGNIKMNIK